MISKKEILQELDNAPLPFCLDGSLALDDAIMLRFHIENIKHDTPSIKCVEIGSYLGKTALFLSNVLNKGSALYCIDTWSLEDIIGTIIDSQIYKDKSEDAFYKQFLSNVYNSKTKSKIFIIRSTSVDASSKWENGEIDLLWIDGDHSCEFVIKDVKTWINFVSKNGIICGDDFHENAKGRVVDAVRELSSQKIIPRVFVYGCHWWFYVDDTVYSPFPIKLKSLSLIRKMMLSGCYKSAGIFFIRSLLKFFRMK